MQTQPLNYVLKSSCPYGFTQWDVERILSPRAIHEFWVWMFGQTMTVCNGETGMHHGRSGGTGPAPYEKFVDHCECHPGEAYWFDRFPSPCYGNEHGTVVMRYDLERFLAGGMAKAMWD